MASGTLNTLDERQKALQLLARGRAEISAEARSLRARIAPKEILRHVVMRHPLPVLAGAFAIGLVPMLLVFQRRRVTNHAASKHEPAPPSKQRTLGEMIVGPMTRALIPLVVIPFIKKYLKSHLWHEPLPPSEP